MQPRLLALASEMFFVHGLQHIFTGLHLFDGGELTFLFVCRLVVLTEGFTRKENLRSGSLSLGRRLLVVINSALLGQFIGKVGRKRVEACRPARLDLTLEEVRRLFFSGTRLNVFNSCELVNRRLLHGKMRITHGLRCSICDLDVQFVEAAPLIASPSMGKLVLLSLLRD